LSFRRDDDEDGLPPVLLIPLRLLGRDLVAGGGGVEVRGQDGVDGDDVVGEVHDVLLLPLGGDGGTRRWFPIHTPTQIFEGRVFFPH
jgi:hypothetical protein